MAQRTINSPGVEIRESDLSFTAPAAGGTSVYITGFAQQGPIDEVLLVSTKQELVQLFGPPSNAAERYFHYSITELLNSPATVYAGRLPYGSGAGDGFGSKYSALVYPVSSFSARTGVQNTTLNSTESATLVFGAPNHIELTESEYLGIAVGECFSWQNTNSPVASDITEACDVGKGGLVILNKTQVANNQSQEGFYVGLISNAAENPATNFNSITGVNGLYSSAESTVQGSYTQVPENVLAFPLSSEANIGAEESLSRVMENLVDYDLSPASFDDYLSLGVFKLRKSLYANEATKLDYVLRDKIVGSINYHRQELNPTGGSNKSVFLEALSENAPNTKVLVNDNISKRLEGSTGLNSNNIPQIKVVTVGDLRDATADRLQLSAALASMSTPTTGSRTSMKGLQTAHNTADLFPLGQYVNEKVKTKLLGDIPTKLERALDNIKNDEVYNIDVVVEGGLGTIYSVACAQVANPYFYDDQDYSTNVSTAVNGLRTSGDVSVSSAVTLRNNYSTIFNKFEAFVKPPYEGGTRGDCIFVADPIRQIVIKGANTKILSNKTLNFQTDVYWAIRHQFENENTSYAAVYGNWLSINDGYTGAPCWVPSSAYAAAAMARTDAVNFPWFAPAGFSRGLISFANDIAVNPNQKQRDELYKANINPIAQFPGSGMVIFGQKTLQKKPSAFDRINVRRLFLALERPTKQLARQFVFEQNSEFTRTRLVNALTPIFDRAKNNEGLYDYLIVCDERNNTPAVIDANELVIDIYIKPTRTAEFILVNFYATRTDANFQELIGG